VKWCKEKEGGRQAVVPISMGEEVPTFFKYCLSDPGRGEAVVREGAKNSVKKGAHLGPLNEGEPNKPGSRLERPESAPSFDPRA